MRDAPPRLRDDAELGHLLSASDAGAEVAPDRLARGAEAVRAAIAAGDRHKPIAWWKIAAPLAVLVGGFFALRPLFSGGGGAPTAPAPAVTIDAAPAPADAVIAFAAPLDAAPPTVDASEVAVDEPPVKPNHRRVEPPPPPAPDAAPATSDLPEQIRLYEDARAAGNRGELQLGLDKIDELLRRFPSTQLRADAELSRAELLTRADRLDDAAAALSALVDDSHHAGRRGELLRALGDVRRKQGDCTAAVAAYTRAQAERLSDREKAKVARGLERCAK